MAAHAASAAGTIRATEVEAGQKIEGRTARDPDLDMEDGMEEGPGHATNGDASIAFDGSPKHGNAAGEEGERCIANEVHVERPHRVDAGCVVVEQVRHEEHVDTRCDREGADEKEDIACHCGLRQLKRSPSCQFLPAGWSRDAGSSVVVRTLEGSALLGIVMRGSRC